MILKALLFFLLGTWCTYVYSQTNFDFYVSNYGSDTNSGLTPLLPKKNIGSLGSLLLGPNQINSRVSVGLKQGHIFNETLFPSVPVRVASYADTGFLKSYAILNGTAKFDNGWVKLNGYSNTFFQPITHNGFTGGGINNIGFYSYVYVIEIDVDLEKTSPITARRPLQYTYSLEQMDTIPGSFFEKTELVNPVNVYVHTSDNKSPNRHSKFRYEVVVRDRAIEAYDVDNNRFENIWARGYGGGFGPLPGGSNSLYRNVIFGPGAGIHHVVLKDGKLVNCLFFPGSRYTNGNAIVFYNIQGYHARNSVSHSMFLDIPESIYSHTSGGENYNSLDISDTYFFGNGDTHYAIALGDTDTITARKIYADRAYVGYSGTTKYSKIEDSYFKDIGHSGLTFSNQPGDAEVKNVFIKNAGTAAQVFGIFSGDGLNLSLSNSLIHLTNGGNQANLYSFIGTNVEKYGKLKTTKNIFISEVDSPGFVFGGSTTNFYGAGPSPDVWDNNVYILYRGSQIFWNTRYHSLNNFEDWQIQSGQDANSLYIDIRNDPRGLKAIFIDPENGNYELANTVYGNRIKKIGAGMITPPLCFMPKPTYERAAEMNQSNSFPALNSCRQPCQQTTVKINSNKNIQNGILNICQGEQIILQGLGVYNENGKGYFQNDNTARFLWWTSDDKDTSGLFLHSFKKVFDSVGRASVKLQMVDINGCTADTVLQLNVLPVPVKPYLGNDTALCNGQTITLNLQNYITNTTYNWNDGTTQTSLAVQRPGSYWIKASDVFGCSVSDTINVKELHPVSVSLGADKYYCSPSPLTIEVKASVSVKTFSWNDGSAADSLIVRAAGLYTIIATDSAACIARDTVAVFDNPLNAYRFPADTAICMGAALNLNIKTPANTLVKWADGIIGDVRSVSTGQYQLTLQNKDCIADHQLNILALPLPVFTLRADTTICEGFTLDVLIDRSTGGYLWNNGNRSDKIIVRTAGLYWAEALLNGCTYRDTFNLKVEHCECDIIMPNAFSPNGDGVNDIYRPVFKCFPMDYKMQIFNRYGQPLFETKNHNIFWDGTSEKAPLPIGTYYYVLSYFDLKERRIVKRSGGITLLK